MKLLHKRIGERSKAGFSIIDVLVSFILVGLMFVSLYGGLSSGFAVISLARENLRATQVVLEKMETVRMYSWDQVNSNGFVPPTFTAPFYPDVTGGTNMPGITFYGTTVITNADVDNAYRDNMRQVTVTVNWTNRNVKHTREMRTLISQYGMQRYIY